MLINLNVGSKQSYCLILCLCFFKSLTVIDTEELQSLCWIFALSCHTNIIMLVLLFDLYVLCQCLWTKLTKNLNTLFEVFFHWYATTSSLHVCVLQAIHFSLQVHAVNIISCWHMSQLPRNMQIRTRNCGAIGKTIIC